MQTFEHYHDRELQKSLKADTARRLRALERKQAQLKQRELRGSLVFATAILVWAVFICLVLSIHASRQPVETPVETVHELETAPETEAATLLHFDPVVDPIGEHREAAEPESPFYREDIPLDYELQEALYAACTETGIRYELALAVVKKETDFRNVVGDGGESYGYMQVQPKWHSERMERLGVDDLMDPAGNFLVGCDYLAELLEKYDLPEALTAYNTGSPGHNQYADTVIGYMEDFV